MKRPSMGMFEFKIVASLVLTASAIFAVSVVLVRDTLDVATSLTRRRSQELTNKLAESATFYRRLVRTRKALLKLRTRCLAKGISSDDLRSKARLALRLADIVATYPDLQSVEIRNMGTVIARREKMPSSAPRQPPTDDATPARPGTGPHSARLVPITVPIPAWAGPHTSKAPTLVASFFVSRDLEQAYQDIGRITAEAPHLRRLTSSLQPHYFPLFLKWFGISIVLVTIGGLLLARRTTKRVTRLARAVSRVGHGDFNVTVSVQSRDEIGRLSKAFNDMVHQIRDSRQRIAYLEKIGAWQEIARRLAHEIKNPLTPIQLAMQQLHDTYDGSDERYQHTLDESVEIVEEEIGSLRRMVEEFSAFAKLPSVQPTSEPVDSIMEEFLRSLSGTDEDEAVEWTSSKPNIQVLVDRGLFKRVLANLVENAVQAARHQGQKPKIRIQVRAEGRQSIWTIDDSGPGISAEHVQRIFDPYFTTKPQGTGLGLAIVKKILLEHQGNIEVASSPMGGARFVIHLPLARITHDSGQG
ncbi:MAG: HAMP domain-containing protein [Deltaproteobacteria bacterium]|nr:HAMP domain-containing protein [Deltaproteobacteria bacterium]